MGVAAPSRSIERSPECESAELVEVRTLLVAWVDSCSVVFRAIAVLRQRGRLMRSCMAALVAADMLEWESAMVHRQIARRHPI